MDKKDMLTSYCIGIQLVGMPEGKAKERLRKRLKELKSKNK